MATVRQLTKKLTSRPEPPAIAGVRLRHFAGSADIAAWLELRSRAFARQKLGVGGWTAGDFEREFLAKPWWRPECMLFAETDEDASMLVGTVTLARRGASPHDKPVVHWLAVLPRFRGRGIGGLLMDMLEAAVWDVGERQIWLETHEAWAEAGRLYAARGYVEARL
jgi:GNAT superfamily N-acetyltransferase